MAMTHNVATSFWIDINQGYATTAADPNGEAAHGKLRAEPMAARRRALSATRREAPAAARRDASSEARRRQSRQRHQNHPAAAALMFTLCVLGLLWPALWNGYPIVFADTGTYLSQAMHRYLGWDRPVFYSFFIWPLHFGMTTWPVVLAQSALTVLMLDLTRRAFDLEGPWLPALVAFLSVATWLPWTVSELMPDLFTPLTILALCVLMFSGWRLRGWERLVLAMLTAFMIATQQSSVPLACALVGVVVPVRCFVFRATRGQLRPGARFRGPDTLPVLLTPLLAPGLAIAGLVSVNTVGFGRVALSPYGNVFVLARVIYDGPGMRVLRRDCQDRGWSLCPWLDRFPATSDQFLWDKASPIMLAGGHKTVSADANAIIESAMKTEPAGLLAATWNNTREQLTRFASGDGLKSWNAEAGSWIDRDFPDAERDAFHAARQQLGSLAVAPPLSFLHRLIAVGGILAALTLSPIAWRRRHVAGWYLAAALLVLPLSAAITGGLSTPHDRYQSRVVWLPAYVVALSIPALLAERRRRLA